MHIHIHIYIYIYVVIICVYMYLYIYICITYCLQYYYLGIHKYINTCTFRWMEEPRLGTRSYGETAMQNANTYCIYIYIYIYLYMGMSILYGGSILPLK